jgi:hypothetical protein
MIIHRRAGAAVFSKMGAAAGRCPSAARKRFVAHFPRFRSARIVGGFLLGLAVHRRSAEPMIDGLSSLLQRAVGQRFHRALVSVGARVRSAKGSKARRERQTPRRPPFQHNAQLWSWLALLPWGLRRPDSEDAGPASWSGRTRKGGACPRETGHSGLRPRAHCARDLPTAMSHFSARLWKILFLS